MLENLQRRVNRIVSEVERNGGVGVTPAQAEAEIIAMLASSDGLSQWMSHCLYQAGHREALGFIDGIEPSNLRKQLAASSELREKVRTALLEAEEYVTHGFSKGQSL